jgi:hypothetical protein
VEAHRTALDVRESLTHERNYLSQFETHTRA